MTYYSLNGRAPSVSFRQAVIDGLAPDKGLYFPDAIEEIESEFWRDLANSDPVKIAFRCMNQFVGEDLSDESLYKILTDTLSFDFPLVRINEDISFLELFHGPTMAFKDVGARFMARCLGHFNKDEKDEVTVLVATSGDTGGAVASGFLGVQGVNVVILYPSGKVSPIQEKQLTTLGQNIRALEVEGSFDDCQAMVKKAFLDQELKSSLKLTSANSINVARWLPQMLYFVYAYRDSHHKEKLAFSVPSGNFGNICAGIMALKLGLPVEKYIASNNMNNSVTRYLYTGSFEVKPTVPTISNAMDVGDPSNFIRIRELFKRNDDLMKKHLSSYSFSDSQTRDALKQLQQNYGYIADPHGAVGYLGAKSFLDEYPGYHCICLETAHPAKFPEVVEETLHIKLQLPPQLKAVADLPKTSEFIRSYEELKASLL